jgi:hypothetical protein
LCALPVPACRERQRAHDVDDTPKLTPKDQGSQSDDAERLDGFSDFSTASDAATLEIDSKPQAASTPRHHRFHHSFNPPSMFLTAKT